MGKISILNNFLIIRTFNFIISLIFFISLSCSKCKPKSYPTLVFSESDKLLIPYSGLEVLTFCDSLKDSISFNGDGRQSHFHYIPFPNDCSNELDYCYSQIDDIWFLDTIGKGFIEISIFFTGPSYESRIKQFGVLVSASKGSNMGDYQGIFTFSKDSIFPGPRVKFHKSVQLENTEFISVYVLGSEIKPIEQEYLSLIYYTVSEGIIALKTNKGRLWVIQKK